MPPFSWVNVKYLDRLRARFLLSETPQTHESFQFIQTVQPVTNVDEVVRIPGALKDTGRDLSGAVTWVDIFTTPTGKRYYVTAVRKSATIGNSGVRVYYVGGEYFNLLASDTADATEYACRFKMNPGDKIQRTSTNNVADDSEDTQILYEEEDVYL